MSLARLFVSLTDLDIVISQQTVLKEHVQIYLRLLKSWKYDAKLCEQVKVDTSLKHPKGGGGSELRYFIGSHDFMGTLQALLKLMTDINEELLECTILRDCVQKVRTQNPKFGDALKETIRLHLAELDAKINENQAQVRELQ